MKELTTSVVCYHLGQFNQKVPPYNEAKIYLLFNFCPLILALFLKTTQNKANHISIMSKNTS